MHKIYRKEEDKWVEAPRIEVQLAYPNYVFPQILDQDCLDFIPNNPYKLLMGTPPPEHDPATQQAIEIEPELVDGELLQRWRIEELPKQLLQCTKVQAIAALSHAGLLADFQEFIRNADPLTQALWEASYLLQSDSPTLLAVWAGMGKTEQELYDLFQVAVEIKV